MLKCLVKLIPDNTKNMRARYGITEKEFLDRLYDQHGLCAVCRVRFSGRCKPVVDHCHSNGEIRGLLCHHCNTGIGLLGESPLIMKQAIKYLNTHRNHT